MTTTRFATAADRDTAVTLLIAQLVEHHLAADPVGVGRGVDLALAAGSPAWLVVAEDGGTLIGILLANVIVSVEKAGPALWVEELYVAPERRRGGIARAILDFVIAECQRAGVRSVDLEVVPTQAAAFALYRKLGFRDVDRARLTLDMMGP